MDDNIGDLNDLCTGVGSQLPALFAEIYGTFIFTSVILAVKAGLTESKYLTANALAISLTLFCVCRMSAGISGAAINPAIGISQTLF